jgi:hypothetical protein
MAFPQEGDLVPHRMRHAPRRTDHLAGGIQFLAFLKTFGLPWDFMDGVYMSQTHQVPSGSFGERKAQADEIAGRLGATPEWRNGYYTAVRQDQLTRLEVHFSPPIMAADAEE